MPPRSLLPLALLALIACALCIRTASASAPVAAADADDDAPLAASSADVAEAEPEQVAFSAYDFMQGQCGASGGERRAASGDAHSGRTGQRARPICAAQGMQSKPRRSKRIDQDTRIEHARAVCSLHPQLPLRSGGELAHCAASRAGIPERRFRCAIASPDPSAADRLTPRFWFDPTVCCLQANGKSTAT